jgi:transcription termination factor Rho
MSEETDNQRPLETNTAQERPRRPRRRFPRRHDGSRGRGPEGQGQRGDLNGPADRVEEAGAPGDTSFEGREGDQRAGQSDGQSGGAEGDFRDRNPSQNGELEREPEFGDGIIEISGKGFGFLRDAKRNFVQTPQDIFVTPEIVRRFGLRDGMWIHGETRRGNRGPQLTRMLKINDDEPTKYQGLRPFEELTTINPNRRIKLETVPDRYTTRIMDLMTPLGMGQRGLIVAPPRTGKTTLLHHIADAVVKNHP